MYENKVSNSPSSSNNIFRDSPSNLVWYGENIFRKTVPYLQVVCIEIDLCIGIDLCI